MKISLGFAFLASSLFWPANEKAIGIRSVVSFRELTICTTLWSRVFGVGVFGLDYFPEFALFLAE
ncbi:hypothetical protein [Roseibaca sp. Y0-43]|uniref:hypothetical protein n=1 Tax=Roseibaca sp. Y0-43 TaxID=2816854 RepID=UPI001D0C69BD|nr:hypothetical protein [Roseibaca sp. Y0-43]MCC1480458.1 hypothetical protein [Roseibaca sp. Y0-43]